MSQLGYTWYAQDWWTSETFKRLKRFPLVRYAIRELFDLMYKEGAPVTMNREYLIDDFNIELSDQEYDKLLEFITITEDGKWWIDSVRKRLSKAEASRENGKKGGRPKAIEKFQNNAKSETQKPRQITQTNNPKNLSSEREREIESKREIEIEIEVENKTKKFPSTTTKEILFSRKISIEQWAMKNKVSIQRIEDCINEFADFKARTLENLKWQNESDMIKNFEFWLITNAKPKPEKITSKSNENGTKQIFRNQRK